MQTAVSGCETLQELTLFLSSGCAGGLVAPKLMTRCPNLRCVYFCLASQWWNATPLVSGRSKVNHHINSVAAHRILEHASCALLRAMIHHTVWELDRISQELLQTYFSVTARLTQHDWDMVQRGWRFPLRLKNKNKSSSTGIPRNHRQIK
jgi:hypothetical protein